jgi:hypothetical protein
MEDELWFFFVFFEKFGVETVKKEQLAHVSLIRCCWLGMTNQWEHATWTTDHLRKQGQ